MLFLDIYKEPARLLMPGKRYNYNTMSGAILSVVTVSLILTYGVFKLDNLITIKEYNVKHAMRIGHYQSSSQFGNEHDGFSFAAGMVQWDEGEGMVEDPSYGQVRMFIKSWGVNSFYDDTFHELETRPCNEADFIIGASD